MEREPRNSEELPAGQTGVPEFELSQLLEQLTVRDEHVRMAQDRLRGLLRANRSIVGELELAAVLRRVIEAACELVAAPYGALGVIRPDGGGLEEFVHVGMDPHLVEKIGNLPEGKGLLGALIEDPRPIRLHDLTEDIRSVGFPDHHPPMRGFLGVPIRVRDEIFGNLYLASPDEGDFSVEDEELVTALATTAGTAIENARLYEEAQRRQKWLTASADVTRQLITAHGDDALRLVARYVSELADADVVTVVSPHEDMLETTVAVGLGADRLAGRRYPARNTLSELVIQTGEPCVVEDASAAGSTDRTVTLSELLPVGPVMVLPLTSESGVRPVLLVGRASGRRTFSEADVEMATTFAHHASVALELVTVRRQAQRMELIEDRSRIARDLHDHVIQQLFAAGMTLQGAVAADEDSPSAVLVERAVDIIDDAIKQIRASIFELRPNTMLGAGLRSAVLEVVTEVTPSLGHDPHVHFAGPVDTVSTVDLVGDVAAVVREALVNVAKHARARRTEVTVSVTGQVLTVAVQDDGVGVGPTARRSGLANLRQRAESRGGSLQVGPGADGRGTRINWQVHVG